MALFLVSSCLAAVFLLIWITIKRRQPKLTLPVPKGQPIVGNVLQFSREKPHMLMAEWAKQLGPVFQLHGFISNVVVVNDYDSLHTVLVTKTGDFGGRAKSSRLNYIMDGGKGFFATNPNPEWKFLRSTLHKKVKMYDSGLLEVEKVNMSVITDLVKEIKAKGGQPFDPKDSVYKAVINIICVFLLGRKYSFEDELFHLMKNVERQTSTTLGNAAEGLELEMFWWLRHFGNKHFKKLKELKQMRARLWQLAKADVESNGKKTGQISSEYEGELSAGILGALLDDLNGNSTLQSKHHYSVSEHTIMMVFHELIFAGTTTTTNSFYAFLNIICHNPQIQEKMREEVDKVVGGDRPVSLTDRNQMPYTRAVILELLRFTSIVPAGVSHYTVKQSNVCGHTIPEGTRIITNLWALHHDGDFWGDPLEFRPERFLDDNDDLLLADHEKRKHVMPFGAGIRVCLGEGMALGRLFLLLTTMAQMFIMKPAAKHVSFDPRGYERGGVLAQPNFEMQFTLRNERLFE